MVLKPRELEELMCVNEAEETPASELGQIFGQNPNFPSLSVAIDK
jgi:hypothetical protein